MTLTFWSLYLPALAILFGLGMLAGIVEARVRSAFRRWRVQREMVSTPLETQQLEHCEQLWIHGREGVNPAANTLRFRLDSGTVDLTRQQLRQRIETSLRRRLELDGLATARDKAERKIQ